MEKQLREEGEEQSSPKAQCIPRLRAPAVASSSSCSARSHRFAPSTLLERFREAVFRLMMLSALSSKSSSSPPPPPQSSRRRPYYPVNEPHHSEALADCIEFINRKKKASDDDSAVSGGPLDAPAEMAMPVPVM
ncbi:hypothetical protein BT93_I0697 [Corymbia citriodora subsp. variegata]|nr:hypothetical protein BT93_I0697 [Corymbia citriodora subsp. variegata]